MIIAYIIAVGLVLLDQITKIIVEVTAPQGVTIIPSFIKFNLTYNTGAAFSFLDDATLLLALISLVASAALGYIVYKYTNLKEKKIFSIALALILGGTVGNLIDRWLTVFNARDGVVDFVDMYLFGWHFPGTFNVADIGLVVGVIMLCVDILILEDIRKKKKTNQAQTTCERTSIDINPNIIEDNSSLNDDPKSFDNLNIEKKEEINSDENNSN